MAGARRMPGRVFAGDGDGLKRGKVEDLRREVLFRKEGAQAGVGQADGT